MSGKDKITDAHNKGEQDASRDSNRSEAEKGWGGALRDVIIGNPHYRPPSDKQEKKAYDKGWKEGKEK